MDLKWNAKHAEVHIRNARTVSFASTQGGIYLRVLFLSVASLLSVIEEVVEDADILRIYGYILFHDSIVSKMHLDK